MVTVVGIEVTGDNVLEVSVLPVQVAGLDSSCKNSPMGAHLCRETEINAKEDMQVCFH